jgi:hypothetical protein
MQTFGDRLHSNSTTPALRNASARALERELSIIVTAAHQVAAGYGLHWDDFERVHEAHQHTIRVLAALRGGEVLT